MKVTFSFEPLPSRTADRSRIEAALVSSNKYGRMLLATNPNLTSADIERLSHDDDETVRMSVAARKDTPINVLNKLATDRSDAVKAEAFSNPNWDFTDFKNIAMTQRFSNRAMMVFCNSKRVPTDLELFEYLWNATKSGRDSLIWATLRAIKDSTVDPKIQSFLDSVILTQSNKIRERYATFPEISNAYILDQMKTDPYRPVISSIASNSKAWSSTHEFILLNHNSASTRSDIARTTNDNNILNMLYNSTKGKVIREAVENNPNFIPINI